jgi:hypothetical protein
MQPRAAVWLAVGWAAMFSLSACKREGDSPPPSHLGNCADPVILDGTHPLGSETTAGLQQALSAADPTCLGTATLGPERVYKVTVPGSEKIHLRVTVIPAEAPGPAAFDPVLYLVRACAAPPVCVAAEDRRGGGSPEVIDYANVTGLPEDLFVVVDGYDFQAQGGTYQLAVDLLPP